MIHAPDTSATTLPAAAGARTGDALRSLMQMWEQEESVDDGETETDLMVMLSGMVGAHATDLGEA
jgi:hypothetical protein